MSDLIQLKSPDNAVGHGGTVTDIRLDIVKVSGRWGITDSRAPSRFFSGQADATAEALALAKAHLQTTGGRATVHLWNELSETKIFDTGVAE